jgi:hypothetical protein
MVPGGVKSGFFALGLATNDDVSLFSGLGLGAR